MLVVLRDQFTRYTQACSTPQGTKAKTAATKLYNDYILKFGTPRKILHDEGRELENKLFTHLSKLCNIKRLRTTLYHLQFNSQ